MPHRDSPTLPSLPARSTKGGSGWRRLRATALATGLSLAALGSPLTAQEGRNYNVEIDGDYMTITINEVEGISVIEFIKLAQTLTQKTFTYSESDISNSPDTKITFVGPKRILLDNFFPFFQTMLYIKGFATLVRGDDDTEVIEVVAMSGPKRTELNSSARYVAPDEIAEYANHTGVPILTLVPLEFIDANAATNQLRPFFLGQGGQSPLTLGAAARALLLQGFGPQVNAAYQVLRLVDKEPEGPEQEIRVVRLDHATAEELEPMLTEVLEARQKAETAQQQVGASGAGLQARAPSEIKIVPHMSLNALLLSGTHEQIVEAQDLIARLDIPYEAVDGDTHVITLRNVLAEDLRATLNQFIGDDLQAERTANAGQAGTTARQPRRTVVVPHKESNSLLISGTASKYRQLARVIDELDRRQPQVLIECAVIELTSSESMRLGIELGLVDLASSGDFNRPFGFTSYGLTSFEDTDGDSFPDTRLPDFNSPLQGLTGGILSSDDFALPVAVNTLAASSGANVLSLPSVVVNNNFEATVRNSESRPTQQISQGNATTTSGAGSNEDAGIVLRISPSISSSNYLRIQVNLTVSRFLTPFDPNAVTAGVKAEREINTLVTMPSGHTMVLGGVIEDQQDTTSSGIPILKDIPILGWLFSSWSKSEAKTNLYFFLTPYILREEDFSDLAEQSFRKKLEAASYIGSRRIQLIDRRWRDGEPQTLDDPGATIEDLDERGGFDIPVYQRPTTGPEGPGLPEEPASGTIELGNGR